MGVHDPFLEGLLWCPGSPGCWSTKGDLPMFKLLLFSYFLGELTIHLVHLGVSEKQGIHNLWRFSERNWIPFAASTSLVLAEKHTSRVYPPTIIPNECWLNPSISQWFIPNSQAKSKFCWWCWWHPPWICHPLWAHSLVIMPKKCHNGSEWCYEAKNDPPQNHFPVKDPPGVFLRLWVAGAVWGLRRFWKLWRLGIGELKASLMVPQVVSYVGTTRVLAMLAKTIWPTRVCRCIEVDLLACQHVINQLRGDWWLVIPWA